MLSVGSRPAKADKTAPATVGDDDDADDGLEGKEEAEAEFAVISVGRMLEESFVGVGNPADVLGLLHEEGLLTISRPTGAQTQVWSG